MTKTMTTEKRLRIGMITVIILTLCLVTTTYALTRATLELKRNTFHSGQIGINLNDGEEIIDISDPLFRRFEPGVLAETNFFIENDNSKWDVYYRVYFSNVVGELADIIEVTVTDPYSTSFKGPSASSFFRDENRKENVKGEVLFHGIMSELTRDTVDTANDVLKIREKRELRMYFYYPTDVGNAGMGKDVLFDICLEAIQTKNYDRSSDGL